MPREKDRTLLNMERFHTSVNWAEWWEEWNTEIDPQGNPKYKTVKLFAKAKAKNERQRSFIEWYIGPRLQGTETDHTPYPFIRQGPLDWKFKRDNGGWFSEESLDKLSEEVNRRYTALDKLEAAGARVTLNALSRTEQLGRRIAKAFEQHLFVNSDRFSDNVARVKAYIQVQSSLASLQDKQIAVFAKSLGINFDQMDGFAQLLAASQMARMQSGAEGTPELQRVQKGLQQIAGMMIVKSSQFGTPLPKDFTDVIDVSAEQPNEPKKKVH